MKKHFPIAATALMAFASQNALAGTFFDVSGLAQPTQAQQGGVTPAYTNPVSGVVGGGGVMGSTGGYLASWRVLNVVDHITALATQTISAPNALGQVTRTQTCSAQFRNPITGLVVYTTPAHAVATPLYSLPMMSWGDCDGTPARQAGNPLGLFVEVSVAATRVPTSMFQNTYLHVRVMKPSAPATVLWQAAIAPTVALGTPVMGESVDVNNDGTDEMALTFQKNVTPPGFVGMQIQTTKQVRNGLTGAILGQYSWVQTFK